MTRHHMLRRDDVPLHVVETGRETAPPILLIHGWSQCHLSWERQFAGRLGDRFRLVAPDLRGHGLSGRPPAPEGYARSRDWAEDIAAVISGLSLARPILVGWSMGGWVIGDYLRHFGDGDIAGYALVGSFVTSGRHRPAEARVTDPAAVAEGMYSDDLAENLAATVAFVQACFHRPLPAEALARMVGFNMLVAPDVRRACRTRGEDFRDAHRAARVPRAIFQGGRERLAVPAAYAQVRETLPDAEVFEYPDAGHGPFWEEAEAFDRDLGTFAARVHGL